MRQAPDAGALPAGESTTIGVVATNAALTKEQANKLASVAHDGIALAVRPAHTMSDGDTMFALATGAHEGHADFDRICAAGDHGRGQGDRARRTSGEAASAGFRRCRNSSQHTVSSGILHGLI